MFTLGWPLPAWAGVLVTGAVRDRAGAVVARARLTAFDGAGSVVGQDVAGDDGTFAIDAVRPPTQVAVACAYCRGARVAVDPAEPVVIFVEHYSAVTASAPSPDDIRALPYRSAADIAALRPFTVVQAGRISDRGLDYEGATVVDGLPFYDAADGSDYSTLVPAHATAAFDATSPLAAPLYGGYAGAGAYDVVLHDSNTDTSRLDGGGAADAALRYASPAANAGYASSWDAGDHRQAADADAVFPFAGGRLNVTGVAMSDLTDNVAGAGLGYTTGSRRCLIEAAVTATQSGAASLVGAGANVRSRAPFGLELGVREARETSSESGAAGAQFDAAVYARAGGEIGAAALSAIAAYEHGGNATAQGTTEAGAFVASLAADIHVASRWSTHTGVLSNLRIPTLGELAADAPVAVGAHPQMLLEQAITYEDLRRLRISAETYTQRSTGSANGYTNGIGIDTAWQVAPQLTLRSWLLRANQSSLPIAGYPVAGVDVAPSPFAAPLTRELVWLTYGSGVRVDALLRGNGLEGDVRFPVSRLYAVAVGSAKYNGRRITTLGLTQR